tara:strand:- start:3503 stop:5038 length:1536 start_codon:yes stop_codon:yes gene_type:complete
MADLESLAAVLGEAADIYYKSKALDLAQEQSRTEQINIEIDRDLKREVMTNEIMLRNFDASMKYDRNRLKTLQNQIDEANKAYKVHTGEVMNIEESSQTKESLNVLKDMEFGTISSLEQQMKVIGNQISDRESHMQQVYGRLGEITEMQNFLQGGGLGFKAGDPEIYDPADFSLELYSEAKEINLEEKPWLEKAYPSATPTPQEIAKLNKAMGLDATSAINIEYKRKLIDASKQANAATKTRSAGQATDQAYKAIYTNISKTLNPFSDLLKQATDVSAYSKEEIIDNSAAYQMDTADLQRKKDALAASFDPLRYKTIAKTVQTQGLSLDIIRQYNRTGEPPKGLTELQQKTLSSVAPRIQQALDTIYVEGFNAVQGLQGASGIPGTGSDLIALAKKRASDYNDLIKQGKITEAQKLAFDFEQVTNIDVSSQESMNDFQQKVNNEGFVTVKDGSLVDIITPDKGNVDFIASSDYMILKDLHDNNDRGTLQTILPQIIKKWGKAEVEKAVGGF